MRTVGANPAPKGTQTTAKCVATEVAPAPRSAWRRREKSGGSSVTDPLVAPSTTGASGVRRRFSEALDGAPRRNARRSARSACSIRSAASASDASRTETRRVKSADSVLAAAASHLLSAATAFNSSRSSAGSARTPRSAATPIAARRALHRRCAVFATASAWRHARRFADSGTSAGTNANVPGSFASETFADFVKPASEGTAVPSEKKTASERFPRAASAPLTSSAIAFAAPSSRAASSAVTAALAHSSASRRLSTPPRRSSRSASRRYTTARVAPSRASANASARDAARVAATTSGSSSGSITGRYAPRSTSG